MFKSLAFTAVGACLAICVLPCAGDEVPPAGREDYAARPIYSEPAGGLQMPPGCTLDPSARARIELTDNEVWLPVCGTVAHAWLLHRQVIENGSTAGQARMRYEVLDDIAWPKEVAGDSLTVQCVGRAPGGGAARASGWVVAGARWRVEGKEWQLAGASRVLRADPERGRFVLARPADVQCSRFPEREAVLRQLQMVPR